jgi:hypothetical protein
MAGLDNELSKFTQILQRDSSKNLFNSACNSATTMIALATPATVLTILQIEFTRISSVKSPIKFSNTA